MTALEADIAREKAAFRAAAAAAAEAEEAAAQAAARGTTTHSRARTAAERNHGQAVVSDSSSDSSSGVPADPYPDQEQEREYVNWLDSFTHLPEVVAEDVFNVARSDTNERPSYN